MENIISPHSFSNSIKECPSPSRNNTHNSNLFVPQFLSIRKMAATSSLTRVPDAPTASPYACAPENSFDAKNSFHTKNSFDTEHSCVLHIALPISAEYQALYPKLVLDPYHVHSHMKPSNVLAFVQNAAKKEIADLVTVVIPALRRISHNSHTRIGDQEQISGIRAWWRILMRFCFFVAETDDDIARSTTEPASKIAKRIGDFKHFNALHKRRKSLSDKYSFAMEVVFRAADRALEIFVQRLDKPSMNTATEKLEAAAKFMLDTMQVSKQLVRETEIFSQLNLNGLEHSVGLSLFSFARSEASLFACICTGWMHDEKTIVRWIQRNCGIRGRVFASSWRKSYASGRGQFIRTLQPSYSES